MKPKYLFMRPLLGFLIMLGFLGLTGYMTFKVFEVGLSKVDREMLVVFVALAQAMILMVKDGFGFYFGSSQGSANKAATIDTMLNNSKPTEE